MLQSRGRSQLKRAGSGRGHCCFMRAFSEGFQSGWRPSRWLNRTVDYTERCWQMQDVKFILIMISVGVCKEVCIRGIQLCFLPTTSFLGHVTEQNNQHFRVDYVAQYGIPDTWPNLVMREGLRNFRSCQQRGEAYLRSLGAGQDLWW